jgi:hypothetical protein
VNRQKKHIDEVVRGAQRRRIICRAQRRADSKRQASTKLAASPMARSSSRRMVNSYGGDGMLRFASLVNSAARRKVGYQTWLQQRRAMRVFAA